jgi:hypothetical protein
MISVRASSLESRASPHGIPAGSFPLTPERGEMAEWLNAAVSKTVVRVTPVPWVRIPLSPPDVSFSEIAVSSSSSGEMSEWLKERAWKARVRVILVPWVRIPLSPPAFRPFRWTVGWKEPGPCAAGAIEPRQVRKEAAIRWPTCVPQVHLGSFERRVLPARATAIRCFASPGSVRPVLPR